MIQRRWKNLLAAYAMTSETRILVEANDITGLEVECSRCHVKIIYPISEWLRPESQCKNCPNRLFDATTNNQTGENVYPAIEALRELVGNLWSLSQVRTDIHANIRLQLKTQPTPR
jgi:hypothetical protein